METYNLEFNQTMGVWLSHQEVGCWCIEDGDNS